MAKAQQKDLELKVYSGETEIKASRRITLLPGFRIPSGKYVRIFTDVGLTSSMPIASVPGTDRNYILTKLFKISGITSDTASMRISGRTTNDLSQSIQYLDGLARPVQGILIQGSPGFRDIVQPISYDALGRMSKQYMPYNSSLTTSDGSFKANALSDQASFYKNPSSFSAPNVTASQYAFSEVHFEVSPLNRVDEKGATGELWKLGSGHTQRMSYGSNNTSVKYASDGFAVRLFNAETVSSITTLTGTGYYDANQLELNIVKDENWTTDDGKAGTIEEYKNKDGQKVLVRSFNKISSGTIEVVSTYYVYDIYGNLSYVLAPGANPDAISIPAQLVLDNYCFQYRYDDRNRVIERKTPGKGWEFIVYNDLDQAVAMQDEVQRAKAPQEWQVIKYDVLGRVVINGIYTYPSSVANTNYRNALQLTVDAQTVFWETKGADLNYTSVAFPQCGMDTQLINYYDDYNFPDGNTYPYAGASAKTKGLQTGSKVKVLGTSTMLLGTVYYDDEGRPVKVFKQHYLGGIQKTSNYDEDLSGYNFSGELISSTRVHHAGSILTTIANRYTYDHAGRKINTYESINGSTQVVLNELKYNEIGQLIKKSLHSTDGTSFAQNSTYAYNERGWLNKINDPNALAADQIFGMELIYGNKAGTYNGNIGTVNWKTKVPAGLGLTEQLQSYTYDYDKLNRLSKSIYSAAGAANKFNEEMGYDISGNITSLKRANNSTGYLNNFTYNYGAGSTAGNQLLGVTDAGTAAQSSSYTYNENGNQKTDSRKGLTIAYNIMNLPQTISKTSTGETLKYVYDAAGQKLRKITGSSSKDYIAGIEYNNGVIESIQTEEGRALPGTSYSYEYTLKDNLGNTRAAFKQNGEIIQIQDYYAFGMEMNPGNRLTPSPDNLYGYNGKEKQAELGLEQLDYGARFYDPVIGRWNVPDMLAELAPNLTPYRYCFNNPVNYIDPLGLYERDKDGNMTITDPFEISDFINMLGKDGTIPSIDHITNYITQNFGLDLPGVTVTGNSNRDYLEAGGQVALYQREALEKAKLDGSVFYGVNVYTSKYLTGEAAGTLPGIGIFVNKDRLTDLNLLMHEFGHVLQAEKYGKYYFYKTIIPASLESANRSNKEPNFYHHDTWTEWSASDLSNDYFKPDKWNDSRFPLLPVHSRFGNYPPMNPLKFY